MKKVISILNNLYNSESKFMLYIYIAIAVITIVLILVIVISSIKSKKNKSEEITPPVNTAIPTVNNVEEEIKEVSQPEPLPIIEEQIKEVAPPEPLPVIEEKPLIMAEEIKPVIMPLPEEKQFEPVYEKPLEINGPDLDFDLTRPIQRISSATELLNEFVNDDNIEETMKIPVISAEELNNPVIEEKVETPKINQPIFSSVFLDQKEENTNKPKINLELTPIRPLKIDEITPEKPTTKELVLNPKVLKAEDKNKLDIKNISLSIETEKSEKKIIDIKDNSELKPVEEKLIEKVKKDVDKEMDDDSLDTKVDIFKHESLAKKQLNFDPFAPKSQEELLSPNDSGEKIKKDEEKLKENTIVISADDLKNKLAQIQTKIKKEDNVDDLLKPIGLDELPDIIKVNGFRR